MNPATTSKRVLGGVLCLGLAACIGVGDRGQSGNPGVAPLAAKAPEQALIVTVKLADGAFGTPAERDALFALETELESEIRRTGTGEYDGNDVGAGTFVFYMYGPDADKLEAAVAPILRRSAAARGAVGLRRYGAAADPSVRTTSVQY